MSWRQFTRTLKTEIAVYRLALQHPNTPRLSRWLLGLALLYLASPIDLVPDWLPVIGQLDDLVLVPLLAWLALRWIPPSIIAECQRYEQHDH